MAVYTDTFTGTNGTLLDVYDATWVDIGNNADSLNIQSNQVESVAGKTQGAYLYNQTFNSKHYSKLVVSLANYGGPAIRCATGANFYYCFAGVWGIGSQTLSTLERRKNI